MYRRSTSKLTRTSFALDSTQLSMMNSMRSYHTVKPSQSDYLRGLVALDWLLCEKQPLSVLSVPAWVIIDYHFDVVAGMVQPKQ